MNKKNILCVLLGAVFVGCGSPSSFKLNNAVPVAMDQNVTVDESSTIAITLSGSDANPGDILSYVIVTQPTNGTFENGVYTPAKNYHGNDSFMFVANDGKENSLPAMVSITITPYSACKPLPKTGQTIIHYNNDDGDLQKGAARSYNRDDVNQIVTDNVTGLMWQDNETELRPWVTQENFDAKKYYDVSGDTTATTYCQNLLLGIYADWRLPTIEELFYIVDNGRKIPAINPIFQNRISKDYWSSATVASDTSKAWAVNFHFGGDRWGSKNKSHYIRCVRVGP